METRTRVQVASIAGALGLMVSVAESVYAQERNRLSFNEVGQTSRYVGQHVFDVGDVPGHQVRIYKVERQFTEASALSIGGVRVVSSETNGFSDYTNGMGPISGYETWTLADGGRIHLIYTGTASSEPTTSGSRRGTVTSTARLVGGSGHYRSIRGVLAGTTRFDTDPVAGFSQVENKGEYWFEE